MLVRRSVCVPKDEDRWEAEADDAYEDSGDDTFLDPPSRDGTPLLYPINPYYTHITPLVHPYSTPSTPDSAAVFLSPHRLSHVGSHAQQLSLYLYKRKFRIRNRVQSCSNRVQIVFKSCSYRGQPVVFSLSWSTCRVQPVVFSLSWSTCRVLLPFLRRNSRTRGNITCRVQPVVVFAKRRFGIL